MIQSKITSDPAFANVLPPGFATGFASASYQIEGGYQQDGRALSIWDDFLKDKENGNEAVDSYNKWKEDVKILKETGSNAYRFSVSWSRVKPLGGKDDPVNEKGIAYYNNLIDALLEAGITPWITIYHWDLPLELEKRYGGWQNEEKIIEDFVAYSELLFERFGDRVKNWITLNEPHIFTLLCSIGLKKPWNRDVDTWALSRTLLLAHAKSVELYRTKFQSSQGGKIGITLDCDWCEPIDNTHEAKEAAEKVYANQMDMFAEPVYLGRLPKNVKEEIGDAYPDFWPEEWKLVKGSSDFFGWNTYGTSYATGKVLSRKEVGPMDYAWGSVERVYEKDGKLIGVKGHNGHPHDVPWGFRKLLRYIWTKYAQPAGVPIAITENGFSCDHEGERTFEHIIDDEERQTYYDGYIKEMLEAIRDEKVEMISYFGWSLLDNLEWVAGYEPRFGITHVDRENDFKRTLKKSGHLLRDIYAHARSD